jgi:hypothetical protein
MDLGDTLTVFNSSQSEQQADRIALRADWRAVGYDLAVVFSRSLAAATSQAVPR